METIARMIADASMWYVYKLQMHQLLELQQSIAFYDWSVLVEAYPEQFRVEKCGAGGFRYRGHHKAGQGCNERQTREECSGSSVRTGKLASEPCDGQAARVCTPANLHDHERYLRQASHNLRYVYLYPILLDFEVVVLFYQ